MYEAWFRLSRRPFSAIPQPDEYFATAASDAAYQTVCRCMQRDEGMAVTVKQRDREIMVDQDSPHVRALSRMKSPKNGDGGAHNIVRLIPASTMDRAPYDARRE